jgi:CdvA-like coiled-coil domain
VHKLISWKHSFRRLNEEYEVARKKRQALDSLLSGGRISQSTHSIFNKEIDDAISEIEKQQKALLEKMAAKVVELEGQVKTLEILLANFEIRHVTGEIGDDVYQRESELFAAGLDTAKHELEEVKEAADQLATGEFTIEEEIEQQPQEENVALQPEEKLLEEAVPIAEDDNAETKEEPVVETVTCTEVTASEANTEKEQQS